MPSEAVHETCSSSRSCNWNFFSLLSDHFVQVRSSRLPFCMMVPLRASPSKGPFINYIRVILTVFDTPYPHVRTYYINMFHVFSLLSNHFVLVRSSRLPCCMMLPQQPSPSKGPFINYIRVILTVFDSPCPYVKGHPHYSRHVN